MATKKSSFFLNKKGNKLEHSDNKKEFKKKRQDNFNANRNGVEVEKPTEEKKPFDKKAYRLKKYSKKYKLDQWEEQRKKRLLREYHKNIKNDPMAGTYKPVNFDDDEDEADSTEVGKFVKHPDVIAKITEAQSKEDKKNPFHKAQDHYNRLKQDKLDKKAEIEKAKMERQQKLQEYKAKKQDRFKKLSKKNKKGQPIMTGRLELLLDKIQKG